MQVYLRMGDHGYKRNESLGFLGDTRESYSRGPGESRDL